MGDDRQLTEVSLRWPPAVLGGEPDAVAAATFVRNGQQHKLRGGWVLVTPSMAEQWLKGAMSNLSIDQRVVDQMAADMAGRRWRPTGEAILLSEDGLLVNGRKRLLACIRADTPFVTLVLHGIQAEHLDTVDNLRGRKLSDSLQIDGEANHRSLGTALPFLWRMRNGTWDDGPIGTDRELLDLLAAHPRIREGFGFSAHKGRLMRLPLFAGMHFLLHRIDHPRAVEFFRSMLEDGAALILQRPEKRLPEGHAVRALNDLIVHERAVRGDMDRNRMEGAAAVALAWEAFLKGVPARNLRWHPFNTDGAAQPFPKLEGWRDELALVPGPRAGSRRFKREPFVAPSGGPGGGQTDGGTSHPLGDEIWRAAFPNGSVPSVAIRMIGGRQEAIEMLARNTANRGKVAATIERYRRDMEAGRFRSLNGQTIKFSRHGRMLDGQHRITALSGTWLRLPFVVVEGLEDTAFEAMDRAETKSFADVQREKEVPNSGTVAAAARLQWFFETNGFTRLSGLSPSNPELADVLARHPGMVTSVAFNNKLRGVILPKMTCWLEYHFKRVDPEAAEVFLTKLATGEDLGRGNPILVLRRRLDALEKARLKSGSGRRRIVGDDNEGGEPLEIRQAALAIMAWNAWGQGKTLQSLAWRGVALDGFPEIQTPLPEEERAPRRKRRRGRPSANEDGARPVGR